MSTGFAGPPDGGIFTTTVCNGSNGGVGVGSGRRDSGVLSRLSNTRCAITSIGGNAEGGDPAPPFVASALRRRTSEELSFRTEHAVGTTRRLCRNLSIGKLNAINLVACVEASSLHVSSRTETTNGRFVLSGCNRGCLPGGPHFFGSGNGIRSKRRTVHPSVPNIAPRSIGNSLAGSRCGVCGLI